MTQVSIRKVEDLKWELSKNRTDWPVEDAADRLDVLMKAESHESGDGDLACIHQWGNKEGYAQLFEVKFPAGYRAAPHAHEQDEVMVVLGGEMHVGRDILRPGSSVAVPAYTIYSFKAGPEGLHFMNFRPTMDISYITPADARKIRKDKQEATPAEAEAS